MKVAQCIIVCCAFCFVSFSCKSPTESKPLVHIRLENTSEFDFDTVRVALPVGESSDFGIIEVDSLPGFEKTDYFQFSGIYTYTSVTALYAGKEYISLTLVGDQTPVDPGRYTFKIGIKKVIILGSSYTTLKLEFVKDT